MAESTKDQAKKIWTKVARAFVVPDKEVSTDPETDNEDQDLAETLEAELGSPDDLIAELDHKGKNLAGTSGVVGTVDPQLREQVIGTVAKKIPPTCQIFFKMLDQLQAIPDHRVRLATAVNVTVTSQQVASKEQILSSLHEYAGELSRFIEGVKGQSQKEIETEVGGRRTQIEQITKSIGDAQATIVDLENEIRNSRQQQETLAAEVHSQEVRINHTRDQTIAIVAVEAQKLQLLIKDLE